MLGWTHGEFDSERAVAKLLNRLLPRPEGCASSNSLARLYYMLAGREYNPAKGTKGKIGSAKGVLVVLCRES